jgi:hypothetical protein
MKFTNEQKAKIFNDWLGSRFKTFEVASEGAPISFLAKDNEDKEYFVHVNVANELSINDNNRYETGIAMENKHFYTLYGMISQGMNVFWFEVFNDGYMIFYLNDTCTPEQLNVLEEVTLIGVTSALHVERPIIKHESSDGKSYTTVIPTPKQPTIIQGSPILGRQPKARVNKRKK